MNGPISVKRRVPRAPTDQANPRLAQRRPHGEGRTGQERRRLGAFPTRTVIRTHVPHLPHHQGARGRRHAAQRGRHRRRWRRLRHPYRQSFGTTSRVPNQQGSHLGPPLKPGRAVLTRGVFRHLGSVAYVPADASPSEMLHRKANRTIARRPPDRLASRRRRHSGAPCVSGPACSGPAPGLHGQSPNGPTGRQSASPRQGGRAGQERSSGGFARPGPCGVHRAAARRRYAACLTGAARRRGLRPGG